MKATDNQIMMAACQIASGILSNPAANIAEVEVSVLAKTAVKVAQTIADEVPDDDDTNITDAEVHDVIYEYCASHEATSSGKLSSLISTGTGMSVKRAKHLIYRAEKLGYIENIGTRWPQYILRKKVQGHLGKELEKKGTATVIKK